MGGELDVEVDEEGWYWDEELGDWANIYDEEGASGDMMDAELDVEVDELRPLRPLEGTVDIGGLSVGSDPHEVDDLGGLVAHLGGARTNFRERRHRVASSSHQPKATEPGCDARAECQSLEPFASIPELRVRAKPTMAAAPSAPTLPSPPLLVPLP